MKKSIYITTLYLSLTINCQSQVTWGMAYSNILELTWGNKNYIFRQQDGTDTTETIDSTEMQTLLVVSHMSGWNLLDSYHKKINIAGNYPPILFELSNGEQIKDSTYSKSIPAYLLDTIKFNLLIDFSEKLFDYDMLQSIKYDGKTISINGVKFFSVASNGKVQEYKSDSSFTGSEKFLNQQQPHSYFIIDINGDLKSWNENKDENIYNPNKDIIIAWYIK